VLETCDVGVAVRPIVDGAACEVEAITSTAALLASKDDWERLQCDAAEPNVFTTWGWMWSWWQSFGRREAKTSLYIITVRRAGRLTAVLPLVQRPTRWGHLRKLEFPDLIFADHMDPLLGSDAGSQLKSIFSFLAARYCDWDLLALRRLRAESSTADQISQVLEDIGLNWRRRQDETYFWLPISNLFERMQSSSSAQTYRRKLRRIQKAGLQCRILEHPEHELGLLDRLAVLERKRLVRGQPAGLLFGQVEANLGPGGWLYVGLLEQGTELVAYELGFRCGRGLWVYTKGFDPAFRALSPGNLLTASIVDYGFEHGFDEYDLLRGREEFKQRLTGQLREQVRFEVWNHSVRSRVAASVYFGMRVSLIRKWWHLSGRPIHPDL
jgi:CelD/BcsL family acetyltransferase involved in cellulose biosynthesis